MFTELVDKMSDLLEAIIAKTSKSSKTAVLNVLVLAYPQIRLKPSCVPPIQD